jgi:hypothetical protein
MFEDAKCRGKDAENDQKGQFANENMRSVRAAFHLAQEMGTRLGECEILLGSMPGKAVSA